MIVTQPDMFPYLERINREQIEQDRPQWRIRDFVVLALFLITLLLATDFVWSEITRCHPCEMY